MGKIPRSLLAAISLAALALGVALITGFGAGAAQAATCRPSPVKDKMNVQLTPNADVKAFQTLKAAFSGKISDGHCAGDSFSFAIPPTLKAQDGATYPLKAPDGSLVATLKISGRTATVTLTKFVETHTKVAVRGFFNARIDDSTSPGGTDNIVWDINGTTPTPVKMGECPNCSRVPPRAVKGGALNGNELAITVTTPPSTAANQTFTFTDKLTSAGQKFSCPVTARAGFFKSRTQWGVPIFTKKNVPVTITACSATALSGKVTVTDKGMAARISLPVTITDSSQASWTDTASIVTNGRTQSVSANVQNFNGGGSGEGTTPATSPSITNRTTTPATTPVTTPGSSGASPSTTSRNFPTAINGGGGPASGGPGTGIGIGLLVGGLLGVLLLAWRGGLVPTRGRHAHR